MTRLYALLVQGFDDSKPYENDDGETVISVRCSGCEALVINGIATHERGCPNVVRETETEDEEEFAS